MHGYTPVKGKTMKKTNILNFIKKIDTQQARVAKERDRLDDLISEMEQLKEDCSEAWDNLQDARDALSRMQ